jgi:internalin A
MDLPSSLSGGLTDNVIDQVRAYYADLEAGAATDAEVKLFVLGNGRVGKTQLVRRLRDQPFDPAVPSTHGVQWHSFPVASDDGAEVRVNLWDFGGQDIYHGSHALFLDRHAVFVLLWHPDFEQGTTVEGGVTMTNHPLPYWLDYIRAAAGDDAVVILAQARADTRRDEHPLPPVEFGNLKVRQIAFSTKTGRGFGTLREQIQEAVRDLLADRPAHQIGVGRAKVRDRLREWIAADQERPPAERTHRTISTEQFADLCDEVGGVSSADALLTFLHRTGVVFHNPDLFGGQVVLDQQWALDAIYTVLNRDGVLSSLCESGKFVRTDFAQHWREHSVPEQELFLGMMQQCDICFKIGERDGQTAYLAPELLPTDRATIDRVLHGRKPGGEADLTASARFRFLHEGVLRSVLARIGRKFGDLATYWKWGVFLYDDQDDARATLEASRGGPGDGPGGGTITVRVWGRKPDRVAQALVAVVNEAAGRAEPEWATSRTADEESVHPDFIRTGRGDAPPALVPGIAPDDEAVVAISYAHGGDADERARNRRDFVNGLERAMTGWGYTALRDVNELRDGGLIREFVPTLVQRPDGRPRRVVLVLSSKYLKSIHCMAELHAVYQLSVSNRAVFARYAVPCVLEPDLDIDRPEGRAERARFWQERHRALAGATGEPDYFEINRWVNVVPEMLAFVANMVTARGFEALTADGFVAVRRMLDRRL